MKFFRVSEIIQRMQDYREKGATMNTYFDVLGDKSLYYGRAMVSTTYFAEVYHEGKLTKPRDECVLSEFPWDHTEASLWEAAEAADKLGGKVYVFQDVFHLGSGRVDSGFQMEVWPTWTGKNVW